MAEPRAADTTRMPHGKKGIRVIDPSGEVSWTTKRGAARILARKLAAEIAHGLVMNGDDYRFRCMDASGHSVNLPPLCEFPLDLHHDDDRAVLKYWPRAESWRDSRL
jgi:hypothetical protein